MFRNSLQMTVEISTVVALGTLRVNRKQHIQMVKEAQEGYRKEAIEALTERLQGFHDPEKTKIDLVFPGMDPPVAYTEIYDTAISMLEFHQGDVISMAAEEVRNLMQDNWGWTENWLRLNQRYSKTVMSVATSKGFL